MQRFEEALVPAGVTIKADQFDSMGGSCRGRLAEIPTYLYPSLPCQITSILSTVRSEAPSSR